MYATYEFYTDTFHGAQIPADKWDALSVRASDYVDYITRGRATDILPVKKAVCAIAERYQVIEGARMAAVTGEKQSETVGSWSVTYRSGAETSASYDAEIYKVASQYLMNTGLLYRGGRCP